MPARPPSAKQLAVQARNRANAAQSTGPRTAEGKARAARNALTHGLRAESLQDEIDVADRARRAELLLRTFEPEDDFELALVHRMAGAFQRLERADHLESQALECGVGQGAATPGRILTHQGRVQASFTAVNRYRATAQTDLFNAYRMLEVYRQRRRQPEAPGIPNEAK